MKIFVEQIVIDQEVLVYSNYYRFTDSEDEVGSDFEYDFEAVYANVDNIQTTILKLYGAEGLVKVLNYFAQGRNDLVRFESLEFEEGSPLREIVAKIVSNLEGKKINRVQEIIQPVNLKPIINQPTDSIFLLSGLLASLPLNEDLNVMRMLGSSSFIISEDVKSSCLACARDFGFSSDGNYSFFGFLINGIERIVLVNENSFLSFVNIKDGVVINFPSNDIQEKTYLLFNKYINITNVTALKTSLIFETEFNQLAQSETTESLPNYLILYNIELAKFESKEKH